MRLNLSAAPLSWALLSSLKLTGFSVSLEWKKPVEDSLTPEVVASLSELHPLLLEEEDLEKTLERITSLACTSIPGCDAAGLTLMEDSKPHTAGATDEFTLDVDVEQFTNGEGPCLQAVTDHEVFCIEDISTETRWPNFIEGARKKGLQSSLSIPLPVGSAFPGALNLYSNSPNSFDKKSQQIAQLFATQAGIAISNAHVYATALRLTNNLREAIKTREVVGGAVGILIERERISAEQAFEMLKKTSQESNTKLHVIAERVIENAVPKKD